MSSVLNLYLNVLFLCFDSSAWRFSACPADEWRTVSEGNLQSHPSSYYFHSCLSMFPQHSVECLLSWNLWGSWAGVSAAGIRQCAVPALPGAGQLESRREVQNLDKQEVWAPASGQMAFRVATPFSSIARVGWPPRQAPQVMERASSLAHSLSLPLWSPSVAP